MTRLYCVKCGMVAPLGDAKLWEEGARIILACSCGSLNLSILPPKIERSIADAFPHDHERILHELKFNGDYFWFSFAGMYVGVEFDGFIHT